MSLAKAANIATIILAFVAAVLLVERRFVVTSAFPRAAASLPPSLPHLIGKTFSLVPQSGQKPNTQVVLILSTKCRFCKESIPLYREISKLAIAEHGKKIRIVALFHESFDDGRAYLQS